MRRFFKDNWWFIVTVASILFWSMMIVGLFGMEANGAQGMPGGAIILRKIPDLRKRWEKNATYRGE